MSNVMEKIKKNKKNILNVLMIIFYILNMYMYYNKLTAKVSVGMLSKILYLILTFLLFLIFTIVLKKINKEKEYKPEKLFLIFAISFGIVYLFATPLFKGHDEQYHWQKAYAISELKFVPKMDDYWAGHIGLCDYIPNVAEKIYTKQDNFEKITYKSEIKSYIYAMYCQIKNEDYEIIPVLDAPTAYYPAVQMLPQSMGILVAKLLGFNMLFEAIFARLFNFIAYLVLGYFSIKLLPSCKYFLAAFLLCPKVMYISTTISGDVFTNSVIIFYISYIFYLIKRDQKITKKDIAILCVLEPLVAINKLVYLPLCFLILLIPSKLFKDKKGNRIFKILLCIFALIVSLSWLKISSSFLKTTDPSTSKQISYIMHNPITYTKTVVVQFFKNLKEWSIDIVGGYMEWGNAFKQKDIISIYVYIVLILALLFEKNKANIRKTHKIFTLLIFLAVTVLIETALYIQWSPRFEGIGGPNIYGVQGRYFTPILLLVALILSNNFKAIDKIFEKLKINNKFDFYTFSYLIILWQIPTILSIFVRNI